MATICKLPDTTIRLIAAGEVITRPVNVIKELLENSLDAGATNIRINVQQAGLKLIEIIDNGHGISRSDAELLCHRYATSKLSNAEDLTRISTFGFRGEALASVSEMACIEVRTFNKAFDAMGWEAVYNYGELVAKPIEKYIPNPGTQIKVTNLFSQVRHRFSTVSASLADERRSILDLVMRYAIHHRDRVTVVLKEGQSSDLICSLAPIDTKPCFGSFFGHDMETNLIELDMDSSEDKDINFRAKAKLVYSFKNMTTASQTLIFILFVNNRLVECKEMKRDFEVIISERIDSKKQTPLIYINLQVPPEDVDVNTHPAKTTVILHHQARITQCMLDLLKEKFSRDRSTRALKMTKQKSSNLTSFSQPLYDVNDKETNTKDAVNLPNLCDKLKKSTSSPQTPTGSVSTAILPYNRVHCDPYQQTIDQLCQAKNRKRKIATRRNLNLRSIHELKELVAKEARSRDASQVIKNSVFVGIFDHDHALIQNGTKLMAINLTNYLKEVLYQFYLFDFGNFPPIDIIPPGNKMKFMIGTYLDDLKKHENDKFKGLKYSTPDDIVACLMEHKNMLEDYLTLKFTQEEIVSIPNVMPDEIPNLTFLGEFLSNLANVVDYSSESKCFHMIGRVLAHFYSQPPANLKDRQVHKKYHDLVDQKLYIAIKNYLLIPDWLFTASNLSQISDTKDLYKVFERC